jgi:hypothetical protein
MLYSALLCHFELFKVYECSRFQLSIIFHKVNSVTTLTWSGFDNARKFDTSTSLPGVWERYWAVDADYEEFNFHVGGTYATHWRPMNEDFFGSYLENVPTLGKLRLQELDSVVTIAGSQMTFDPPYNPIRTVTLCPKNFLLDVQSIAAAENSACARRRVG